MKSRSNRKNAQVGLEAGKAPFQVIRRIREAILDGTFKPGDRLLEADLGERFKVSRSPIREAKNVVLRIHPPGVAIVIAWESLISSIAKR